jgi:hypothetical protein
MEYRWNLFELRSKGKMMFYEKDKTRIEFKHENESHDIPTDSIKIYQTSKAK